MFGKKSVGVAQGDKADCCSYYLDLASTPSKQVKCSIKVKLCISCQIKSVQTQEISKLKREMRFCRESEEEEQEEGYREYLDI